jgi:polyhydroxyalkanoate synthesis regulator phasin
MARSGSSSRGATTRERKGRERPSSAQATHDDVSTPGRVAAARDRLVRSLLSPLNAVLLTRRHIEEVVEDAVSRGRMTRSDAQEMVQSLMSRSARATDDFLSDLERMLGGSGDSLDRPTERGAQPIPGYDDLSAAQVQGRLDGLTPAELRKLRDYEARHGNRKTVLDKIDRKLRAA